MKHLLVLKTKKQHKSALKRIDELLDINPRVRTPEGRELKLLIGLVVKYEEIHYPMGKEAKAPPVSRLSKEASRIRVSKRLNSIEDVPFFKKKMEKTRKILAVAGVPKKGLLSTTHRRATRSKREKNILQLLDELPKVKMKFSGDARKAYYEKRRKKYGF